MVEEAGPGQERQGEGGSPPAAADELLPPLRVVCRCRAPEHTVVQVAQLDQDASERAAQVRNHAPVREQRAAGARPGLGQRLRRSAGPALPGATPAA